MNNGDPNSKIRNEMCSFDNCQLNKIEMQMPATLGVLVPVRYDEERIPVCVLGVKWNILEHKEGIGHIYACAHDGSKWSFDVLQINISVLLQVCFHSGNPFYISLLLQRDDALSVSTFYPINMGYLGYCPQLFLLQFHVHIVALNVDFPNLSRARVDTQ